MRRVKSRIRIIVPFLIALIALLGVSCGGSDGDVAGDVEDSSVAEPDESDGSAAEPDEFDGSAAEPDESDDTAGQVEVYCRMSAEAEALLDYSDPLDPESLEAALRGNVELIDAAIDIASDEIRDDLRMMRGSFGESIAVLEENAWDFIAAMAALNELSSRPEFEAAEDRIRTWEDANCDFPDEEEEEEDALEEDPFSSPEVLEAMLSSDAGRAMMIEGMTEDGELTADQAECLLDNLDFDELSALAVGAEAGPTPEMFTLWLEIAVLCDLDDWFEEMGGTDEEEDALEKDPFSSPEVLEAMLSSDAGRAMMIEGMTEDGELTADQAECLLDNLDFDELSALVIGAEPTPEMFTLWFEIAVLCDLDDWFEEMGGTDGADGALDAELLEAMLGTEAGRAMLIEGFVQDTGATVEQGECLIDNLDTEILVLLGEAQLPAPEDVVSMLQVFDTCGLNGELFID